MSGKHHWLSCLFGLLAYLISDAVAIKAIVGGQIAGSDQFPYQISLTFGKRNTCGGGLISDQHVLTAAHCVMKLKEKILKEPEHMTVLAGTNNLHSNSVRAVRVAIENVYVPDDFSTASKCASNDIAVLKLKTPFKLKSNQRYLKVLTLPSKSSSYAGNTALIAGFGWDRLIKDEKEYIFKGVNSYLRYADALVLTNDQCHVHYPTYGSSLTKKHMCAQINQSSDRSYQRGVCIGDSGSPLVINKTVVGILSRGPESCAENDTPAIYTRVSYYLDFIRNAMKGKSKHDVLRAIGM